MPNTPRSARPLRYSSGILASRSITRPDMVRQNAVSRSIKASPRSTSSALAAGHGWMRPRSKLPRYRPLAKLGLPHSVSRAASAMARASSAEAPAPIFSAATGVSDAGLSMGGMVPGPLARAGSSVA